MENCRSLCVEGWTVYWCETVSCDTALYAGQEQLVQTVGPCGFVSRLRQASFEPWRSTAAPSHAAESFSLAVTRRAGHMPSPCGDVPAGTLALCKAIKQPHNPLLPVCAADSRSANLTCHWRLSFRSDNELLNLSNVRRLVFFVIFVPPAPYHAIYGWSYKKDLCL